MTTSATLPTSVTPSRRLAPALTIVVPTRNERHNVEAVAERLASVLGETAYELLFVDDSDDETPEVITRLSEHDLRVRLIHRRQAERAGGLSTAVLDGLRAARSELIAVMDADLQHPPETLVAMLRVAPQHDIVVASRYIPGGSAGGLAGAHRLAVSRGSAGVARLLFSRVRLCTDPMSGFFLMRRSVIEGCELNPVGFKILLEVLVRGQWSRLAETPYTFAERRADESKASVRQGIEYGKHLLALRLTGRRRRGKVAYRCYPAA